MFTFILAKAKILAQTVTPTTPLVTVPIGDIGVKIPDFSTVLTFIIRTFFIVGGLVALIYLFLGAISWITSGGNKENVDKAREKIQAAIIGLILIFVILAVVALLENLLGIGLGLTKEIKFVPLTTPSTGFE